MNEKNKHLLDDFEKPSFVDWVKTAEKSLKNKKISDMIKTDYDGLEIKPIYNPDDIAHLREQTENMPGEYPYLRAKSSEQNVKPAVCGIVTEFKPEKFNKQLIRLLDTGQNAIHVKFISPDDDANQYTHGVVITTPEEIHTLFSNINLSHYPIYLEFNYNSGYAFDLFEKYLNSLDIDPEELNINICFDPIADLADKGYSKYPLFDLLYCLNCTTENEKHINSKLININGTVYKKKGAAAVQEIAYALAESLEYIYYQLDNEYTIDEIASKIHFTVTTGSDFFVEIAKIRAMRAFWAYIIKELGGNEKSQKLSVHLVSDTTNKSPLDKETNILRETAETAAAIIAGVDALMLFPYTFPYEPTDEFSLRITKNIQLVLQYETDLLNTIDPAAGSWFIESLTNEIIKKIKGIIRQIDEKGGLLNALKQGFIQEKIKETANKRLANILTRKDALIGVNKYPNPKDEIDKIFDLPVKMKLQNYLDNLDYDIAPPYLDEESIEIEPLDDFKPAEIFYQLRKRGADYEKNKKKKLLIFVAAIGAIEDHKARVDFIRDFLAAGGFHIEYNEKGYQSTEDALSDWEKSKTGIFAICSTDTIYTEVVPALVEKFKNVKPATIAILAGHPKDKIKDYKKAGINYFIHTKSNIVEIINELYTIIEK